MAPQSSNPEPTGDCYEAAGRYLTDAAFVGQADGYTLVHGVVSGQGPLAGRRIDHAWVEVDDGPVVMVVDVSNGRNLVLTRDDFYRLGRVVPEECDSTDLAGARRAFETASAQLAALLATFGNPGDRVSGSYLGLMATDHGVVAVVRVLNDLLLPTHYSNLTKV